MGHSSVTVTERYAKLKRKRLLQDFKDLKSPVKKIDEMLNMTEWDTVEWDTAVHLRGVS